MKEEDSGNQHMTFQQLIKSITRRVWGHMRVIAGTVYLLALAVWCGLEDIFSSNRIHRSYKTP
jgi:hypothetical protein